MLILWSICSPFLPEKATSWSFSRKAFAEPAEDVRKMDS